MSYYIGSIYSETDDLEAYFVVLLNDQVFVFGLVAWRCRIGIEIHLGRNTMPRDKALERTDLASQADLVDLRHDCVEDLAFKWPKNYRSILNRIHDKASTWLNQPRTDRLDASNHDDKSISKTGFDHFEGLEKSQLRKVFKIYDLTFQNMCPRPRS